MNIFFWRRKHQTEIRPVLDQNRIEKMSEIMDEKQLLAFVADLTQPESPVPRLKQMGFQVVGHDEAWWSSYSSQEEKDDAAWKWVSIAPIEYLDMLLRIITDPQNIEGYIEDIEDPEEEWAYGIVRLIGIWGTQRPAEWLPKIEQLLHSPVSRRMAFKCIVQASQRLCLPLLRSLVPQIGDMSEDEAIDFIDAVFDSTPSGSLKEGQEVLLLLEKSLPHNMIEAQRLLARNLKIVREPPN